MSAHVEIANVPRSGIRRGIAVADASRLFFERGDRCVVGLGRSDETTVVTEAAGELGDEEEGRPAECRGHRREDEQRRETAERVARSCVGAERRERSLGAFPWGDLAKIDQQSPQRFAKNFKTPTLVMHGEKDYRVPITQGFEFYNTLRLKGVPTRLVYFPDENHWILSPQNARLWHREFFAWLEKHVGATPTTPRGSGTPARSRCTKTCPSTARDGR